MESKTIRLREAAQDASGHQPRIHRMLGGLFPAPAELEPKTAGKQLLCTVAQVAAVILGAVLLLERVPGLPSWDTIYGEDYWEFFTQALQHPWHVYIPDGGYEEFLPRVLAQVATYLPLPQVSRLFAVSGATIAAGCALFVFHASAGHIRSLPLRALLGAAVVLMPIAPMEIADSGVASPWYVMLAAFWALLWRPKTRTGMAMAALVAFTATSSEVTCFLFAPLVAVRLFVLRRPREHAVTAGWLAGCLLQLPAFLGGSTSGDSRLSRHGWPLAQSLAFYAHDTVLPSFGWHLAWRLQSFAGKNGATVIMAILLTVLIGAILATQPRNRPLVVAAVLTGIVFCLFEATLNPHVATYPVSPDLESGSRYTVLPIFLLEAAALVGVDHVIQQRTNARGRRGISLRPAIAVLALVAVLGASWVADFRYAGFRSDASWAWGQIVGQWQYDCDHSRSGEISVKAGATYQTLPCDRMHP